MEMEITKYRHGDYWGVYENGELLCVTVYKKGAQAVVRRVSEASEDDKARQELMFETEDLPLFSGTPMEARASVYDPKPAMRQARLGACPLCFDTGYTKASGDGLCLCPIGEANRQNKSRKDGAK